VRGVLQDALGGPRSPARHHRVTSQAVVVTRSSVASRIGADQVISVGWMWATGRFSDG
jgi:hypothetical protein